MLKFKSALDLPHYYQPYHYLFFSVGRRMIETRIKKTTHVLYSSQITLGSCLNLNLNLILSPKTVMLSLEAQDTTMVLWTQVCISVIFSNRGGSQAIRLQGSDEQILYNRKSKYK